MAAKWAICPYCQERFNRNDPSVEWVQAGTRRYAHKECQEKKDAENAEKDKLTEYIQGLFGYQNRATKNEMLMKKYKEEFNYTYSGMLKALIYFYDIKGNSTEKAYGSIGILPYIYEEAKAYYRNLWEAQQRNEAKPVECFAPKVKNVTIKRPVLKTKVKRLFGFLEEE